MVYLEVFEDRWWVHHLLTNVLYIFHLAVNVSPGNVIHTPMSVSLLANLFYWQNESITYVTPHFSKENENLQFVSFHYWHNQNFGAEHSLNIS